jgi:hypothetical protein
LILEDPQEGILGGQARLELVDGSVIEGEITTTLTAQNGMGSVLLHGEGKRRVQAEELRRLEVTKKVVHLITPERLFSPGLRSVPLSRRGKIIQREAGADFRLEHLQHVQPAQDAKFVFRSVTTPKGKTRFLQVLNIGFDHRIQVVRNPIFLGVLDRERQIYLVLKDGGAPFLVKKSNYGELFEQLFGDCQVTQAYEKKFRKFSNFAEHLYMYHRFCPREE